MPEFLLRAGTSEYHVSRYYSQNGFVRAYRLVVLLSCVLSMAGGALWLWRRTIFRRSNLLASRLKSLLAIQVFRSDATLLGMLDRYAGLTLLAIATIILVFSMFTMPIRSDEASMYTSVASSVLPLWSVAYIAPNNHVGYAALVWAGHFIWSDGIPGMRIFSLFAWVLSIVILHQILVELFGHGSISLVALAMTLPMTLTLAVLARGYSVGGLLIYASLLMGLRRQKLMDALLAGVTSGIALWIVPSMFYGVAFISAVIMWKLWEDKRLAFATTILFSVVAVLTAAILYLPVILVSGTESLLANEWITPRSFDRVMAEYGYWLLGLFADGCQVGADCSLFAGKLALIAILCAVVHRLFFDSRRKLLLPLLAVAVFMIPLVQRVLPPPRTMAFMAPIILILCCGTRVRRLQLLYTGLATLASLMLLLQGRATVQNDIGFASDHAQPAAQVIARSSFLLVQTSSWIDRGCLRFYLNREGWRGDISVVGRGETFDAPWVFEGRLTTDQSKLVLARYQPTSVIGLYTAAQ
jgi:hypothetical protein